MLKTPLALLIAGATLVCAQTTNITIQNPGFETATLPISSVYGPTANLLTGQGSCPGWTAGSTTPTTSFAGVIGLSTVAGQGWWDGKNAGFITAVGPGTVALSQTLSAVLQNNTTYTLSAIVAGQPPAYVFNYSIELWAGNTRVAASSKYQGLQNPFSGKDSVTFSSGPSHPQAGQPLMIVLSSGVSAGQTSNVGFDDISLTATPGIAATNVLPQLAFGGGWYTALYFTNTNAGPVSFPVNFIDGNGNPLNTPSGTSTTVNLQPRGAPWFSSRMPDRC